MPDSSLVQVIKNNHKSINLMMIYAVTKNCNFRYFDFRINPVPGKKKQLAVKLN